MHRRDNQSDQPIYQTVQEYYREKVQKQSDLKTNACCCQDIPEEHKAVLSLIEDEILEKFYGCGSPLPPALKGATVLDLGCGTGRDVYLASYFAGPEGFVIGVDMTESQLQVARRHLKTQMERFGFRSPNVDFRLGYIEDLKAVGIEDESIDVVISNCVINLSPSKKRVFEEIFRVLKPGGELYFSDVFAGRRIPTHLQNDPVLYGECLAGAMYIEDFRRTLQQIGIAEYRVVTQSRLNITNPDVKKRIGMIDFYSMTIRAFKLDDLEDICEDYGQIAIYKGNLPESPHRFVLDDHHVFIPQKPMLVCGNTASILQNTRYAPYFEVQGDRHLHFGPFHCKPSARLLNGNGNANTGGSCC